MKTAYFLSLALLLLAGCKEAGPKARSAEDVADKKELTLIQGYPEGFAGCSCVFSRNPEEYREQRFVYLEKFGMVDSTKNYKMISLDGEPVRWFSGEKPEGFEAEVLYDREKNTDLEVREITGRLLLRFKDGRETSTPIFGYCGC